MGKFTRMPKMKTTEPSVDEVKMKKGGKAKKMADGGETDAYVGSRLNMPSNTRMGKLNARDTKEFNKAENSAYGKELSKAREMGIVPRMTKEKQMGIISKKGTDDMMPGDEYKKGGKAKKMAMGGDPRMAAMPAQQDPRMMAAMKKRAMMARQPAAAGQSPMMMRKEGGKMDKSQDKAMIKKAFKQHDMQEHKGGKGTSLKLKKGGMKKFATGGVINGQGGYKDGGMPMVEKDGKMIPTFAADGKGKMKTGGKAMMGGGMMRGYKEGGHVAMSCKAEGGFTTMKKMAKC